MQKQTLMTVSELKQRLTKEGEYSVGGVEAGTLLLRVWKTSSGFSRAWLFKLRAAGKQRKQTIGPYSEKKDGIGYNLERARKRANEILAAWREGRDIVKEERAEKEKAVEKIIPKTIADYFPIWLDFQRERKSHKYSQDFVIMQARFDKYLKKKIGHLTPAEITAADIGKVLSPLCFAQPATMAKIQGFLIQFFRWCQKEENGFRPSSLNNPASREILRDILPPKSRWKVAKSRAMCPLEDLPRFVQRLTEEKRFTTISAMACLFEILTASRFSNIGKNAKYSGNNFAVWEDIDLENENGPVWIIPANKMKAPNNGPHIVPLAPQAVAILQRLEKLGYPKEGPIFVSPQGGVISDGAFARLIKVITEADKAAGNNGFFDSDGSRMTLHGTARAGLRTWAADNGYSAEVAEAALHHKLEELGTAYLRSQYLKERRKLMKAWADYCLSESPKNWAKIKKD